MQGQQVSGYHLKYSRFACILHLFHLLGIKMLNYLSSAIILNSHPSPMGDYCLVEENIQRISCWSFKGRTFMAFEHS